MCTIKTFRRDCVRFDLVDRRHRQTQDERVAIEMDQQMDGDPQEDIIIYAKYMPFIFFSR